MTFQHLIWACLIVFGVYKLLQPGMLLGKQGDWLEKKIGDYWSKPLFTCPPCMASVHGTWYYLAVVRVDYGHLPLFILALCGLNFLIASILWK